MTFCFEKLFKMNKCLSYLENLFTIRLVIYTNRLCILKKKSLSYGNNVVKLSSFYFVNNLVVFNNLKCLILFYDNEFVIIRQMQILKR